MKLDPDSEQALSCLSAGIALAVAILAVAAAALPALLA